ncbi:unnamed protein product [Clavelina lepadiformis]|uniref:Uncharacterized protein n=1 Tax=Clavelina lepadiformis TaxID=159417 RepID=A0ABP0FH72_CLALP
MSVLTCSSRVYLNILENFQFPVLLVCYFDQTPKTSVLNLRFQTIYGYHNSPHLTGFDLVFISVFKSCSKTFRFRSALILSELLVSCREATQDLKRSSSGRMYSF